MFWASICLNGWFLPSLSVFLLFGSFIWIFFIFFLFALDCECTMLWQFYCGALLVCMVCCSARSPLAPYQWNVLCECSAFAAKWWSGTHASSTLWPGLPKEPPRANPAFYFKPSLLILHITLTVCHAERSERSHICLELEFFCLFVVFVIGFLHWAVQYYSYRHWLEALSFIIKSYLSGKLQQYDWFCVLLHLDFFVYKYSI